MTVYFKTLICLVTIGCASLWYINSLPISGTQSWSQPMDTKKRNPRFLTTSFAGLSGGLGNHLFVLVSLLGIAETLNRTAFINAAVDDSRLVKIVAATILPRFPKLLQQFQIKFVEENMITRTDFQKACCKYVDVEKLKTLDGKEYLHLNGAYFQSYKYMNRILPAVRDWLTPKRSVMEHAKSAIPDYRPGDFVVCTHIRRGDFVTKGFHAPSEKNFTKNATEWVVEKQLSVTNNIYVMLMGDDRQWALSVFDDESGFSERQTQKNRKNYTLMAMPADTTEVDDFAFSRQFCDAVVITAPSSTFGWMLGFMSKEGSTVYYRDIDETADEVTATFRGKVRNEPRRFLFARMEEITHWREWVDK